MTTMRPEIHGTRHAVSTGHSYATQAAFQMLEDGGNAIDAGVCAGIALGILQSDLVSIGGVAPIILYSAEEQQIITVAGLGGGPNKRTRSISSGNMGVLFPLESCARSFPLRRMLG